MAAEEARWAIVVDESGALRGWVGADESSGDGTVADRAERMDAWVTHDASLKDALATMLQWDAGWVAVLEGETFLGVLTPNTCTRRCAARSTPKRKASPWSPSTSPKPARCANAPVSRIVRLLCGVPRR